MAEFQLTPAPGYAMWLFGGVALMTLVIGGAFAWLTITMSNLSVSLEADELHLQLPFYGRTLPLDRLDVSAASVVDLTDGAPYKPRIRTNGIGLPGYAVGWFKLNNGDKALAALTQGSKVLHLPTRDGYVLLLGVTQPQALLEHLQTAR